MTVIRYILLSIVFMLISSCTRTESLVLDKGEAVEVECLPIYGNWCGEGYPAYEATGHQPDVVDVWDSACKSHDLCYDKYGDGGKRYCDGLFSDEIDSLYQKGYPIPHAISAAYALFTRKFKYDQIWISKADFEKPLDYSCRGGDGKAALFCDVGKGRDDCQADVALFVETGTCFCDYSPSIWDDATRYWGDRVYPAVK